MADGLTLSALASGLPVGEVIATLKGSLSGHANQQVAPTALVDPAGSEGSWAFTPVRLPTALGASGGVKVHITGDDGVDTTLDTDDGTVTAAQANIPLVLPLPYTWNGAAWVRGGLTPYHLRSAATNNANFIKAAPGIVGMITASNTNASPRWLKFYNKTSAPVPASETPVFSFMIPGGTDGRGTNIPIPKNGIAFSTGIAIAIVTGEADNDNGSTAAGEVHVNIGWA